MDINLARANRIPPDWGPDHHRHENATQELGIQRSVAQADCNCKAMGALEQPSQRESSRCFVTSSECAPKASVTRTHEACFPGRGEQMLCAMRVEDEEYFIIFAPFANAACSKGRWQAELISAGAISWKPWIRHPLTRDASLRSFTTC